MITRLRDTEFMEPLVEAWTGKVKKAFEKKKVFREIAAQCEAFHSHAVGFMWNDNFRNKFMRGSTKPKFQITMQKAFELDAVFGPSLYWRNPQRVCKPRQPLDIPPELFGPQGQPLFQQIAMEEQQRYATAKMRCELMQRYLNYTPLEQPGGLARHSELAIKDALITGRGCLWVEPFSMNGSERALTGSFFDSVHNLLIDPDAKTLDDAWWIARRYEQPYWFVEREYDLPRGSLKQYASEESENARGEADADDLRNLNRARGETFDSIVYYKIWSKGGVGERLAGVDTTLKESFKETVGDYAHIVVAPGVPWPLNAPRRKVAGATKDGVAKMFEWPIPFWTDNRWPVAVLDFYPRTQSPWPIAPLAPGLGELMFLNLMVSHLASRIWSSSRDFIAVLKSAHDKLKDTIKAGDDQVVIELEEIHENINNVVSFLQQPQTNFDVWRIIEHVSQQFEMRVGLSPVLYAQNPEGTQSRTATDAKSKQQAAGIRPERMAQQVEAWQTEIAKMEKFCARWFVQPPDVVPLMGQGGATLWQQLITSQDPELVVREMDATIEAGSSRKPNKDRDNENLGAMGPALLPHLANYAQVTTDSAPLNHFYKMWGDAIELDTRGFMMKPWAPPPPPPEVQQQMQAQQQLEQQKLQADVAKSQAAVQKAQVDAQSKAQDAQVKAQQGQQQLVADAQRMQLERERQTMELLFGQAEHRQGMEHDNAKFELEARQDTLDHQRESLQDELNFEREFEHKEAMGKLDIALKKKAAAAQPKPASKPSGDKK